MLLITTFVEIRVVAGRSRMRTGSTQADVLWLGLEKSVMVGAWHGHGMVSVNGRTV